jgi:HlyD family secretion protein
VPPVSPGQRLSGLPSFRKQRPASTATEVASLGRLTPRGEVIDIGGLMGDRLGKLKVEEGQTVAEGDVLGYLESYSERKAERDAYTAQLAEARARLAAETAQADAQIREAEVAVRQANNIGPLDVKAQEATVRLLEGEVATAQADLDRIRSVTKGVINQSTIDQQAQLLRRRQEELTAARAVLDKASQGLPLSQDRAQAQLEAARAGRERVGASVPIESLTKALALAEVRMERTILKAPRAGTVLKILTRPGERVEYKPILKLADTSVMYAVAEVYQNDALLVRAGQRAQVGSQALPRPLSGTVERVGLMIYKNDVLHVDPAADADARVVEVWIRLDSPDAAAQMTNLQVDVLISLD